MPVLPDVESKIVWPGFSFPLSIPRRTMFQAARALTDPLGLQPSSLPKMRTPGGTCERTHASSTSGVLPIRSTMRNASSVVARRPAAASAAASMTASLVRAAGDGRHDADLVAVLDGRV